MSHHQTPPIGAILQLAASQIEVALQVAESQVATLSDAVAAVAALAAALPASLGETATAISQHARAAIVAMQYHDQLMQRLAHVRDALTDLQRAIAEPAEAADWRQILGTVRGRFSMEDERMLFDKMLAWPTDEMVSHRVVSTDSARGCVELF